jgi:hypothetical protein
MVESPHPESFLGDSWFTGIRCAEWAASQGHAYFGALKTATRFTPFAELIETMKDWPSGAYLVTECTTPKLLNLICIGYKYNKRKVLVFLGTKNAGSTKPGEPYKARFMDRNGNMAERRVQRPDVISKYFGDSNVIDSHNQARQGVLKLEKRWITHDCWFRIDTTIIAMTVTDCWRAFKHAFADSANKKNAEMPIKVFADYLAHDCVFNCLSKVVASSNGYLVGSTEDVPVTTVGAAGAAVLGDEDDISTVTAPTTATTLLEDHVFGVNPDVDGSNRPRRRVCRAPKCKKEIHWKCFHPRCLLFQYKANSETYHTGVFYCSQHQQQHFTALLSGSGNV